MRLDQTTGNGIERPSEPNSEVELNFPEAHSSDTFFSIHSLVICGNKHSIETKDDRPMNFATLFCHRFVINASTFLAEDSAWTRYSAPCPSSRIKYILRTDVFPQIEGSKTTNVGSWHNDKNVRSTKRYGSIRARGSGKDRCPVSGI
jgi:hypothetical protein